MFVSKKLLRGNPRRFLASDWVEQVVEGVKVLHGKGHAGVITSTEALIANAEHYERLPFAKPRRPTAAEAEEKVDNVHLKPARQLNSNSQERILRRLARDAPEVLERVKTGEFVSASAETIDQLLVFILFPVPLNWHKREADKPKAKAKSLIASIPDVFRNQ